MSGHKIISIKGKFENMKAFLAHIAEDEHAVGFVGCVLRKDPEDGGIVTIPVHHEATLEQTAFAAALLLKRCVPD